MFILQQSAAIKEYQRLSKLQIENNIGIYRKPGRSRQGFPFKEKGYLFFGDRYAFSANNKSNQWN